MPLRTGSSPWVGQQFEINTLELAPEMRTTLRKAAKGTHVELGTLLRWRDDGFAEGPELGPAVEQALQAIQRIPHELPIASLGLSAARAAQLSAAVGGQVTYARLIELSEAGQDPEVRTLARFAAENVRADVHTTDGTWINHDGIYPIAQAPQRVVARRVVQPVYGESEELTSLRKSLEAAFLSQTQAVPAFMGLAEALDSRSSPPAVLAISGNVGHGKDQAVKVFTRARFSEKGKVVTVDLANVTDKRYDEFFNADDGLLGEKKLVSLAKLGGSMHLLNAGDLSNAPKMAMAVQKLLMAVPGDKAPAFHRVPWIFDFNGPVDPRAEMIRLLGEVGNLTLSGVSAFADLTPAKWPTLLAYAKTKLRELLDREGLQGVAVSIDCHAEEPLGRALATAFAPLDVLELRLQRLVMKQIGPRTSYDPSNTTFLLRVNPELNSNQFEQSIRELHQEHPRFFEVEKLFELVDAAKVAASPEELSAQISGSQEIVALLVRARDTLFPPALVVDKLEGFGELRDLFEVTTLQLLEAWLPFSELAGAERPYYELLSPAEGQDCLEAVLQLRHVVSLYEKGARQAIEELERASTGSLAEVAARALKTFEVLSSDAQPKMEWAVAALTGLSVPPVKTS